jgi:hypothetical protein
MIILSIDPGCKNLGYSLIKINNKIDFKNIDIIELFFKDNDATFIELNNINLLNQKKTKCINETIYDKVVNFLLNIMDKIQLINNDEFLHIIIEKQMKISVNISEIASIINTFFTTYFILKPFNNINLKYKITTISPHFKNKIAESIDQDGKIRIQYTNQYQYNKFLVESYFLQINDKLNLIDQKHYISGSGKRILKLNDISDSFIQILSFFKFYLNT